MFPTQNILTTRIQVNQVKAFECYSFFSFKFFCNACFVLTNYKNQPILWFTIFLRPNHSTVKFKPISTANFDRSPHQLLIINRQTSKVGSLGLFGVITKFKFNAEHQLSMAHFKFYMPYYFIHSFELEFFEEITQPHDMTMPPDFSKRSLISVQELHLLQNLLT